MSTPRPGKPRAVLYLRQSVAREESISLELQETAGRDYAKKQGYRVVGVESDPGISGRTWKRPAVQRVMHMVEAGEADVVILWKWSRLSRSRMDWAVAADRVDQAGGRIESATEPLDVSTSTGRLARGMLTEFAAFESERIGDVWKESHERRVRAGKPANGKARFGYAYDQDTKSFHPDPVTGPILAQAYRRYLAGESVYSLVGWLNDGPTQPVQGYGVSVDGMWSARTVRRVLDSGFAAGFFTHRGEPVQGIHEPLITADEWTEYQARRATRRVRRSAERSPYLLSGLIRCWCGATMNAGLFGSQRTPKYRCKAAGEKRLHTGGYVTTTVVESAVLGWLQAVATDLETAAKEQTPPPLQTKGPSESQARRKLVKLQARLETLTTRYADDEIPREMYDRVRTKTQAEIAETEAMLRDAQVEQIRPMRVVIPDLLREWDSLPIEARRDMLSRLIHPVVVRPMRPRSEVAVAGLWEAAPNVGEFRP